VVVPAIRQALDEILDAERERHKSELLERTRGLELAVAKLESALAQLQLTLATERGQTLDLPSTLLMQADELIRALLAHGLPDDDGERIT
jgi:hypothetical protein